MVVVVVVVVDGERTILRSLRCGTEGGSAHKHRWNELKMTVSDFRRRGKRTFRSSGAQTCVYFYGAGRMRQASGHAAQGDALLR